MNAYDRMVRRLRGMPVDRPPNFNMMAQFAAHYIGEPLSRFYLDYRVLCAASLAVFQDFSLDIVQTISDPYREAVDFGLPVRFPHDEVPVCDGPLIRSLAEVASLAVPVPSEGRRMNDRLAAIRHLREQVGGQVPIMGWVEGALTEAALLCGEQTLLAELAHRPAAAEELLEICAEVSVSFARAQVAAGADIIGLSDSIAAQLTAPLYARAALPYEQRVFAAVREMGAIGRLHICGDTTHLLHWMPLSGADIIDIDWMVDLSAAQAAFGPEVSVCGNFDAVKVMQEGTPAAVREATLHCLEQGGERSFSAAGCEIRVGTPLANLQAQAAALREARTTNASRWLPNGRVGGG